MKSDYSKHFRELSDSGRNVEKDALCNHLHFERERINRSFDKINSYTSVFLVVAPLLITTIKWDDVLRAGHYGIVLVTLFIYISVNIGFWIYQALSVRGTLQSSFKELKNTLDDKETEYASQIYFDWQQTKRNADLFVSIVLNLQIYIMVLIITISLIAVVPFVKDKSIKITPTTTFVYNLNSNDIYQTYSEDAVKWNMFLSELHTDRYHKIIVLYNNFDNVTLKQEVNAFNHQKIEWIYDDELVDNQIKIILEE